MGGDNNINPDLLKIKTARGEGGDGGGGEAINLHFLQEWQRKRKTFNASNFLSLKSREEKEEREIAIYKGEGEV